jgi:hypothetical protein
MTRVPKKELDLSFLNQGSEEIELPSRGVLYNSREIKNGKVHVRPWLTSEEKLIDKFSKGNFYNILKRLVQNVLEEKFPVEEFTIGDFFYLLYWIRGLSYGSTYKTETDCPNCGARVKPLVDLAKYEVTYLPDCVEPMSLVLPKSQVEVKFRLTRLKDLIEATEKSHSETLKYGSSISPDIYKLARCVVEMTLPNEDKTVLTQDEDFGTMLNMVWPKLPAIDILALREEMAKYDHGYVKSSAVKCPVCEDYFEQAAVLSFDFFRPSS